MFKKYFVKIRKKHILICLSVITVIIIIKICLTLYWQNLEKHYQLRFLTFHETFSMNRLFDLKFQYLIKNNCTRNSNIKAILVVTSYAGKFEARSALRRAYPQETLTELGVYRVFLLAKLKPKTSEVTQGALLHENKRYNDIVQGNFLEDYKNLTYKHIMGIGWAATECQSQYVIKMDDDIAVDMYSLMKLIESKQEVPYDLMGYTLTNMVAIRQTNSKWYVSLDEYSAYSYPSFLSGWCYVMKFNTTMKLLNALQTERYFWIDDVFVTGMLAQSANLVYEDISEYFVTDWRFIECCVRDSVDCGFIAAPCGLDFNINIEFQKHSKMCHEKVCSKYTNGKTIKNSCIVSRKLPSLENGTAEVKDFQI